MRLLSVVTFRYSARAVRLPFDDDSAVHRLLCAMGALAHLKELPDPRWSLPGRG